jgi:hypothetical protein
LPVRIVDERDEKYDADRINQEAAKQNKAHFAEGRK